MLSTIADGRKLSMRRTRRNAKTPSRLPKGSGVEGGGEKLVSGLVISRLFRSRREEASNP